MITTAEKADAFRKLHEGPGVLVLPNAWEPTVAVMMEAAGFPAVGTTSAGIAYVNGYPDGERLTRDEMLGAVGRIAESVRVPVTADLEAGFGEGPEEVAETVRFAIEAGAVGVNLEDGTGDPESPLREIEDVRERISAARQAAVDAHVSLFVNARTDVLWAGPKGAAAELLDECLTRARAYLEAGADGVFVPLVEKEESIVRLVRGIDAPVNLLAGPRTPSIAAMGRLGVRRVSIGSALVRAVYGLVRSSLEELRERGTFTFSETGISYPELNAMLARARGRNQRTTGGP